MLRPSQVRPVCAAAFFAALVAFQSVGWFLTWQGLRLGARFEAQRVLYQEEVLLQENTFHKDFFQKIKVDRREIRLNGHLFDFRVLAEFGDSIRVTLYHDQFEEALLSALGQVFQPGGGSKADSAPPVAVWLAQWLGSTFLLPEKPMLSFGVEPHFQKHNFTKLVFAAQSAPSIFVPPPEV